MAWSTWSADRIRELLLRSLQEVLGEGDEGRRRAASAERCAEHCTLYLPSAMVVGREALGGFAGELRAAHPGFVYTPHDDPQGLHNAGRLARGSGPRGAQPDCTGWDVIIVRDGRIAALYAFPDEGSAEAGRAGQPRPS